MVDVLVKSGENEARFSGTPDEVLSEVIKFFTKVYPALEVVSRVTLSVDVESLSRDLEGIVAIAPEGPVLLASKENFNVEEIIESYLIASYIGYKLGKLDSDTLSSTELVKLTESTPGTVAGRLSGLVSRLVVERVSRGEYRITTLGIKEFCETVIPKIKGGS